MTEREQASTVMPCDDCFLYEPCNGRLNPFRSIQGVVGVTVTAEAIRDMNKLECPDGGSECVRFEAARSYLSSPIV